MSHKVNYKAFEKTTVTPRGEWVAKCPCGWKEKARTESEIDSAINRHRKMPHRSMMQPQIG